MTINSQLEIGVALDARYSTHFGRFFRVFPPPAEE